MFAPRKCACFLILIIQACLTSSTNQRVSNGCPAPCTCIIQSRESTSHSEEWSTVKCVRNHFESFVIEDLKLNQVEPHITQLELTLNVTYLKSSFLKLIFLEKLDLSGNGIKEIDDDAFLHLRNLKKLDLSHNKISNLRPRAFEPLESLERLKLNNNLFVHIFKGVFNHLKSLRTLDISENPLNCDCSLIWVIEWSKNSSVKLSQTPKCKSPLSSKGKPLKKLKLQCNNESNFYSSSSSLELKPMHNQIVFEGDSLSLRCRSMTIGSTKREGTDAQVIWSWKNKDPSSYFEKIQIENHSFAKNGFVESQLKIDKIQKSHSGDWYCHLFSDSGNHSTAISVIVLSEDSKYCPQIDTKDNKGIYLWPKTIVGFTVDLPCAIKQPSIVGKKVEPRAIYSCSEAGIWENLNTTHCPYVSETTRILEQFSQVNLSIAKGSVLDSALKLKNFTGNGKNLTDIMDIVFISKTIENYLLFIKQETELGYVLVDIMAKIMELPKSLLVNAQKENMACSKLVDSLEVICRDIPTFQSHKANLVVEEFEGTGAFSGIRCIWYINYQGDKGSKRFFHCSTNNRTLLESSDRIIEASIQIPTSLFTQLEKQEKFKDDFWQLIISMYENNNFFPGPSNSYDDVTSCVIGSKLVGIEVTNLTDPVYLMLRIPPTSYMTIARPVWWNQALNNGSGGWVEEGCQLSHYAHGMVVFHCNRFGYFGLLQDTRFLNNGYNDVKIRSCHPAIYTGSFILIVCLCISCITYLISHNSIQMSRRAKHAAVNTWISISFLCFIFSCGIYQTENASVCQSIGIVLHYLFLSTLLWMTVSASNMYKRLSKADPLDAAPDDDLPPGTPIQKPILGLYLVGWGIGLIVCGISGAVNLKEYASRNFCFLEFGPALSAVYVPAGMLFVFLTLLYILTLCAIRNNDLNGQLSEGTQGTENVDLELLEVPPVLTSGDRRSIQSLVATDSDDVEDPEHSPIIQLKANIIVLLLYFFICGTAALSLSNTFFHQQDITSILYCVLSFCLGAFILYFYCVARSDVRSQWTILKKVLKGEQINCCRSRSVSDTHGNVQMASSVAIPNGTNARHNVSALSSSSVNSSGVTVKSNSHNSNRIKAVKKLNSCDSKIEPVSIHSNMANNVNLVAMHRQMYRSNNSMPNYREILGPDCAEAFYNPRQSIVARKFFKKQRRNKRNDLGLRRRGDGGGTSEGEVSQARRTWRPSAESAVFLSSDMENMSEKVEANNLGYGCKLSSANHHIESNDRQRKSISPKTFKNLTNSDDENRNKLPLDRLVIGAEEEPEALISLTNKGRITSYDYCLSRVDELSTSEDLASPAVISFNGNETQNARNVINGGDQCYDCQNDCYDIDKMPNYRNVELQCSLGENSFSDLTSENNYCNCAINNEQNITNGVSLESPLENLSPKREIGEEEEDVTCLTDNVLDCNSFNKKIDAFNLHLEIPICESDNCKTESCSHSLNNSNCINVLNSKLKSSDVTVNQGKKKDKLDLPNLLQSECEVDALFNSNDSEKTKKETSV